MKKLAILIASIMLLAPVSNVLGSNWQRSQWRMQKAYLKWQKQESEFWKRFQADMDLAVKGEFAPIPIEPDEGDPFDESDVTVTTD